MKTKTLIISIFSLLLLPTLAFACVATTDQADTNLVNYNNQVAQIKTGNFQLTSYEQSEIQAIRDKYNGASQAKQQIIDDNNIFSSINIINPSQYDYINQNILKGTPYYIDTSTLFKGASHEYQYAIYVKTNLSSYQTELAQQISMDQNLVNNASGDENIEIQNLKNSFIPEQISMLALPDTILCVSPAASLQNSVKSNIPATPSAAPVQLQKTLQIIHSIQSSTTYNSIIQPTKHISTAVSNQYEIKIASSTSNASTTQNYVDATATTQPSIPAPKPTIFDYIFNFLKKIF